MRDKTPFLRWLVVACVTMSGLFILWQVGVVGEIWRRDASHLSAFILCFFAGVSVHLGMANWRICSDTHLKSGYSAEEAEKMGWFSSDLCLGLGMLGTVIGLIMMLSGFDSLDPSDPSSIQNLLSNLGGSMGTALYTTMTGLACGMNLKIQAFSLNIAIQRSA